MIYKPQNFSIPDTIFPRFLFTDIFIIDNNIGLISIVYPDVDINFEKIECIINNKIYYFTKKIINRIYESNVFLETEDSTLNKIISKNDTINLKIKYKNLEKEFNIKKIQIKNNGIVFTTLFKDDYYLFHTR